MLNLQILKCFQHLSKLIKTMMGSSPWKNMSRFSGSKLRDIYSHIYEKLHFNNFSEHGVNISKEEVALYFSSKVSFLKLRSSRAWALRYVVILDCGWNGLITGPRPRRKDKLRGVLWQENCQRESFWGITTFNRCHLVQQVVIQILWMLSFLQMLPQNLSFLRLASFLWPGVAWTGEKRYCATF